MESGLVMSELGLRGNKSEYRKFVEKFIEDREETTPFRNVKGQCILGSEPFFYKIRDMVNVETREIPQARALSASGKADTN